MPEYEEKGISREEKVDLYQALDKLSPDYRKVLILRYFQDMKIKEIGEVMQIPVTVIPKEVFFDGSSLYIGFQLKTQDEEGFGQEVLKTGVV